MFRQVFCIAFLGCAVAVTGCAKKPEDVASAYISPLQYERYTCRQLAEEAERISVRVAELSGVQRQKRTGDMLATTAAVVIFWPAAFMVGGDDAQTAQLARLKGEFETIQKVAIQKNCGLKIQVKPPRPAPPKEEFKPFT